MIRYSLTGYLAACLLLSTWSIAQEPIADPAWRFSLDEPKGEWHQSNYDDQSWQIGEGGFGTPDTPGSRVGTNWSTKSIWLRRMVELASVPREMSLYVHHDENCEIFINGILAAKLDGFSVEYQMIPISEEARRSIVPGKNSIAVHCSQTGGGQFIDVHLVEAGKKPKLPRTKQSYVPYQTALITRWGKNVRPDNAWQEYPRPQMERSNWTNLNGRWDYAVVSRESQDAPEKWDGKILVPFSLESKLGGVQRLLDASESLWYRTSFQSEVKPSIKTLIHFEAVDYRCQVFVNGKPVGQHVGGNTPFSIDATPAIQSGSNELTVRVDDDTEEWQLRGKQVRNPNGIWYTQVSGIWQTVWTEQVPEKYIEDLIIRTESNPGTITVKADSIGLKDSESIRVKVLDGRSTVVESQSKASQEITLKVKEPKLWSPANPHLYGLVIELLDGQGKVIDSVQSYAGIRSVGKKRDAQGHLRMTLNDQVVFHWGTLDQGWWPDGLLTPPSDEALAYDIQFLKDAGFNMIRKHIKVEPRRFYYHCDRLGMLLWQDQVSAGRGPNWTRLAENPNDADWSDANHAQFMLEFERMIDHLENHPSIVVWIPFNEAWGQHRTMAVGKWAVQRDPSRLINIASGGNFWPVGDIVDEHQYPHPGFPFNETRYKDFVKVVGEFGGHGLVVPDHIWKQSKENWGYGGLPKNAKEYRERYVESIRILKELQGKGIAAGIYTQTTDVEGEVNGLLTYDREVAKLSAEELREIHEAIEGR